MKTYRVGILVDFEAEDWDHAVEQFLDYVIRPENRKASIDTDVEGAINVAEGGE